MKGLVYCGKEFVVECDQIGSVEMTPTWRGELKGQESAAVINKNERGFYGNHVTHNED